MSAASPNAHSKVPALLEVSSKAASRLSVTTSPPGRTWCGKSAVIVVSTAGSTVQSYAAGLVSTLPAASTARTRREWTPSASWVNTC